MSGNPRASGIGWYVRRAAARGRRSSAITGATLRHSRLRDFTSSIRSRTRSSSARLRMRVNSWTRRESCSEGY